MWKQQEATNLLKRFFIILVFTAQFLGTTQTLSDKRLCADINCREIISLGKGVVNYPAGEEGMVSFKINAPIRIKSKSAGSNPSLWGIEVNGREGFAPKRFIREIKVIIKEKNLKYEVDVKPPQAEVPSLSTSENLVEQENTVETTLTKQLNVGLAESTEKPIINNLSDKLSLETPVGATPVLAETVDGTQIPTFSDSVDVVENVTEEDDPEKKYEMEMINHEENEIDEYDQEDKEDKYVNNQEYQKPAQDPNTDEANINNDAKSGEDDEQNIYHVNEKAQHEQNYEIEEGIRENNTPEVSSENNLNKTELSSKNVKQPEQENKKIRNVFETHTTAAEDSKNSNQAKKIIDHPENLQNSTLSRKISEENKTKVLNSPETQYATKDMPTNNSNKTLENIEQIEDKAPKFNQNTDTEINKENNIPETSSEINSIKADLSSKGIKQTEQENAKINNVLENNSTAAKNLKNINQAKDVTENHEDLQKSTLPREISQEKNTEVSNSSEAQHATKETPTNNSNTTLDNIEQVAEKAPKFNQNTATEINKENNTPEVSSETNSIKADLSSKSIKQLEQEKEILEDNKTDGLNSSETKPASKETPSNNSNKTLENFNQNIATEINKKNNTPEVLSENNSIKAELPSESVKQPQQKNEKINDVLEIDSTAATISKNINQAKAVMENHVDLQNSKSLSQISEENKTDVLNSSETQPASIEKTTNNSNTTLENVEQLEEKVPTSNQNIATETDIKPNQLLSEKLQESSNEIENNKLKIDTPTNVNIKYVDDGMQEITNQINSNSKETKAESSIIFETTEKADTSGTPPQYIGEFLSTTTPKIPKEHSTQEKSVEENISPTTYNPHEDISLNTPLPNYAYQELPTTTTTNIPPNDYYTQQNDDVYTERSDEIWNSFDQQTTESSNNVPTTQASEVVSQYLENRDKQPKALLSSTPTPFDEIKENEGLFAKIMDTVNNMFINKRHKHNDHDADNDLNRILFSKTGHKMETVNEEDKLQYCKKLGPNGDCPEDNNHEPSEHIHHSFTKSILGTDITLNTFLNALATKILEISELLAFLVIVSATSLVFIFGYYCFCNSSREGALLSKLNQLESSLLASHKENSILKHNLMSTRHKLASIEDNSFGSNDMVVSLRKELEEELMEKARLQDQITVLQKELENAADAGIELNKIVSELLSNQTGDESIISSVEELQKQLNEQQNTILEINASLAEKSRENSELQLLIAEQNARYETELANVQRDNDELEHEKGTLLTRLDEMKNEFDKDITAALEGKNLEIKRLQNEFVELTNKLENGHTKWQTSVAKIEALEECLKNVRKDPNVNITEVIDVAYVKAQLIEIQKKYKSLKERLEIELDSKKLAENQLQMVSAEVEKLKQDFNQSEKDKLEAQTRLEVLSNYFKDKENQLQKELSLKEAMWLKQQGETTTTVDRVTAMQKEIQSLKSQNDSLRAEIEAQVAAHKAQTGTLENRAHETWLAARQSDRRYEEIRAEATALRRKLTALAGGNVNEAIKPTAGPANLGDELTQAPSPIHMESPGSPMLGRMPPPPFLPPPFMGPPPPFMGLPPPPPFVPPGEMRPAPLGRIMSPPPQRSGRFSPQHLDYEDYLDYEGTNTWHRHTYSPPPRTYRSLSPTDSRYNYCSERDLMSTYDTETDFSPPPSPRESRRRGGNSTERINSNSKGPYVNAKKNNTSNKGPLSSGSEKSCNTPSHYDTKSKKGNRPGGGGKTLV